jgi:hypothetical protein
VDFHLVRIPALQANQHLRKWLKGHPTLSEGQKIGGEKAFVGSDVEGNAVFAAEGRERRQFRAPPLPRSVSEWSTSLREENAQRPASPEAGPFSERA